MISSQGLRGKTGFFKGVALAAALTAFFGAGQVPSSHGTEIKSRTTTTCKANGYPQDIQDTDLSYASIVDKKIFSDSPYMVFVIQNWHSAGDWSLENNPDLFEFQKNVYLTLEELDKKYCLDIVGHEGVDEPLGDLRAYAPFRKQKSDVLDKIKNTKGEERIDVGLYHTQSGSVLYSILNSGHLAYIVDPPEPDRGKAGDELNKLAQEIRLLELKKLAYPDKRSMFEEQQNRLYKRFSDVSCQMAKTSYERGVQTGKNIADLLRQLNQKTMAVVYGGAHSEIPETLGKMGVSYAILRPFGLGNLPQVTNVREMCMK